MKFTINKQDFQRSINTVIHVAYNKNQKSILECIHITAANDKIIVNAFDTVTAIETCASAEVIEEGSTAIPARLLFDVIVKLAEGELLIEKEEPSRIKITSSKTCVLLTEMDETQYPPFPNISGTSFEIKREELKTLVDGTSFAVYTQTDKPVFTGLLMETEEQMLNVVAIDGIRMAKRSIKKENGEPVKMIIPAKAMREATRIMDEEEDEIITISADKSACFIYSKQTKVYTRLLDGEFMNYNNIIPKEFTTKIKINAKMLEDSLTMVSVMTRGISTNPVKLMIRQDMMELSASSEFGVASDSIPVRLQGDVMNVTLNAKYLLDVLRVVEDEEVMMLFESPLKPCILKPIEAENYLYLIVPLNIRD